MLSLWHPWLALVGGTIGVGAVWFGRRWRGWSLGLLAGGSMVFLYVAGHADGRAVSAVLIAALSPLLPTRPAALVRVGSVVLLVFSLSLEPHPIAVTVAVVGVVLAVAIDAFPGRLTPLGGGAVAGWAALACWASAPDTEEVLVIGCALLTHAAMDAIRWSGSRLAVTAALRGQWFAPLLALLWAAGQGFRGRPGGLPVLWVVTALLAGWPVAERLVGGLGSRNRRALPPLVITAAVLAGGGLTVVAARTVGLRRGAEPGEAAALAAAVLVVWLILACRGSRTTEP